MQDVVVNFMKLPGCGPCEYLEKILEAKVLALNLPLKKIVAKRHESEPKFTLVHEDGKREELLESMLPPGFPVIWLSYPNGSISKVVVGALAADGEDALSVLLRESQCL